MTEEKRYVVKYKQKGFPPFGHPYAVIDTVNGDHVGLHNTRQQAEKWAAEKNNKPSAKGE